LPISKSDDTSRFYAVTLFNSSHFQLHGEYLIDPNGCFFGFCEFDRINVTIKNVGGHFLTALI